MNTVVLKFGGSSVADNIKLNVVAQKIIEYKEKANNVVVVVSAQGKTTDRLINEAQELSAIPEEREMDMLLSAGEQVSAAKLSILLNRLGYPAVSLTGWQAGIQTNKVHKNAKIETIYPQRINEELEKNKIVIVAGFQGIDKKNDITTLGRGGSDTTAVAIEAAIEADKCYIFSDVDGIYSADPNIVEMAKKLNEISFTEIQEATDSGAKVLHNRCIQIGEKFDCDIIAKSTFENNKGTKICKNIESSEVRSIVKNDKLTLIRLKSNEEELSKQEAFKIYHELLKNNIIAEDYSVSDAIEFRFLKSEQNKAYKILDSKFKKYNITQEDITKIAIVGYSIAQDNVILNKIVKNLKEFDVELIDLSLSQSKIELIVKDSQENVDKVIEKLHENLIVNS